MTGFEEGGGGLAAERRKRSSGALPHRECALGHHRQLESKAQPCATAVTSMFEGNSLFSLYYRENISPGLVAELCWEVPP